MGGSLSEDRGVLRSRTTKKGGEPQREVFWISGSPCSWAISSAEIRWGEAMRKTRKKTRYSHKGKERKIVAANSNENN